MNDDLIDKLDTAAAWILFSGFMLGIICPLFLIVAKFLWRTAIQL